MRESKWDEAISAYDRALKTDAQNARCYGQRALAFIKVGKGMKALKDAEMYMQMMPSKVRDASVMQPIFPSSAYCRAKRTSELARHCSKLTSCNKRLMLFKAQQ